MAWWVVVLPVCRLSVVTRSQVSLVLPWWAIRLSCPVSSVRVSRPRRARKSLSFLVTWSSLVASRLTRVASLVRRKVVVLVPVWSLPKVVRKVLTRRRVPRMVALSRVVVVLSCPRLVLVCMWLPVVATRLSVAVASLVRKVLVRLPYRLAPLRVVT